VVGRVGEGRRVVYLRKGSMVMLLTFQELPFLGDELLNRIAHKCSPTISQRPSEYYPNPGKSPALVNIFLRPPILRFFVSNRYVDPTLPMQLAHTHNRFTCSRQRWGSCREGNYS
jgi:hypothetical protein